MPDREEFLRERKKGVGGSDIASVFSVGYGCRLRLWREKIGEVPDFPREENDAMRLGQIIEPFFAEKYAQATGRRVSVRSEPTIHPQHPELRVNVDRMIGTEEECDNDNIGVLELKSVGRAQFFKLKREGLPDDYILQLQHGIECTGTQWGAFGIGSRDSGELLRWDVAKDPVLAEVIVQESRAFWREVQEGIQPTRLEPDDSRCQRCEYRNSCQGAALIQIDPGGGGEMERDETLAPLVLEYLKVKALADEAESALDGVKEQLKTELADRTAVEAGGHKIYYRPQTSMRGDFAVLSESYNSLLALAKAVEKAHPNAFTPEQNLNGRFAPAESFKKPSSSRPFRMY